MHTNWCVTHLGHPGLTPFSRLTRYADNALSKYILTRLPDRDPLSDSSLERIRTWIDVCNTSHSACDRTDSFLPTRLIDISQYNQSEAVKLIESEGLNGQYVALSHCWGTSKSFTTTTKTLDQRKRGMMVQDLPKTFQDAIRVTDLLHVQYLWIDSICIIQDDPNDWEEQSGQMSQVYSNSYITIAAARSADDLEGFLGMRSDYLQVNVDFSLGSSKIFVLPVLHGGPSQTDIGKLNDMPLNTRAWTLQERYLSRRLLHFSRDQTYWECILGITSERGVGGERASSVDALLRGLLENNNDGASLSPTNPPWIGSWSTLVSRYSRRNLTIARDRLPALAGLARQIAEHTGDRYCAGLWWSSIGYDLCWAASFEEPQVSSRYEPERFLGPSWSWASVNVPITFLTVNERATLCAKFLSCELEISGQNPYGVVKGGRLKVKAPLVEIYPDVKNVGWPWWDRGVAYPCFALILWDTPSYTAVLVKPTLRMDGEYWKVGCASPLPQQGDRIPYSEDDIRTITLV